MNREEARNYLESSGFSEEQMDTVEQAFKALEQEPCEDAISRQAVEDKLVKMCDGLEEIFANIRMQNVDESVCGLCEYDCPAPFECKGFDTDECFKLADEIRHKWQSTKDLPSVTPKQRTGHWEWDGMDAFLCSECASGYKEQPTMMGKPMFEYCPICGAKMEEQA